MSHPHYLVNSPQQLFTANTSGDLASGGAREGQPSFSCLDIPQTFMYNLRSHSTSHGNGAIDPAMSLHNLRLDSSAQDVDGTSDLDWLTTTQGSAGTASVEWFQSDLPGNHLGGLSNAAASDPNAQNWAGMPGLFNSVTARNLLMNQNTTQQHTLQPQQHVPQAQHMQQRPSGLGPEQHVQQQYQHMQQQQRLHSQNVPQLGQQAQHVNLNQRQPMPAMPTGESSVGRHSLDLMAAGRLYQSPVNSSGVQDEQRMDSTAFQNGQLQQHLNGAAASENTANQASLYVKGLPPDTDEIFLYRTFAPFGGLSSCKIQSDPVSGKCRGVAFINYVDQPSARRAMQSMNGVRMAEGRQLQITLQAPRAVRAANACASAAGATNAAASASYNSLHGRGVSPTYNGPPPSYPYESNLQQNLHTTSPFLGTSNSKGPQYASHGIPSYVPPPLHPRGGDHQLPNRTAPAQYTQAAPTLPLHYPSSASREPMPPPGTGNHYPGYVILDGGHDSYFDSQVQSGEGLWAVMSRLQPPCAQRSINPTALNNIMYTSMPNISVPSTSMHPTSQELMTAGAIGLLGSSSMGAHLKTLPLSQQGSQEDSLGSDLKYPVDGHVRRRSSSFSLDPVTRRSEDNTFCELL